MCRTPVALTLSLALIAAAPAAAGAQSGDRPPLAATLAACESGAEPEQRFAVFTGSMPASAGTVRMAIRFTLFEARGRSGFRKVRAPRWGRWERSGEGRSGFIYTKRVAGLGNRSRYRAVLRFRWYSRSGRVLRSAVRRTPVCRQVDQRPNLRVLSVTTEAPDADGIATYRAVVLNDGRTAAEPSTAELRAGDRTVARPVARLAPGERVTVLFRAPGCRYPDAVPVEVDARDEISESRERDNRFVATCTVGIGGPRTASGRR